MILRGFKRFKTKKGQDVALCSCERNFVDSEKANADECAGVVFEQVWLWGNLAFEVKKEHVGQDIFFQTEYINGKNDVVGVHFDKTAGSK